MKMPVLAAFLSLIAPGAGHFLLGERVRGAIAAVLGAIALLALPFGLAPWWLSLVIRPLAIGDVLVGVRTVRPVSAIGVAIASAAPIVVLLALYVLVLGFFRIPASSMEPTIHIGQHVVIDKLHTSPSRGDVIVFSHPCTKKDFIKRVIALPGDTVEIRCNLLYVNGAAVPETLVDERASYQDLDEESGRRIETHVSRYREGSYEVFHGYDRPELDRDRTDQGSYWDAGNEDVHDFPELDDPAMGQRTEPRLPSCGVDDPRRDSAALGTIVAAAQPPAHPCDPQAHYVVPPGTVFVLGDNRQNSSDSRIWGPVPVGMIQGEVIFVWGAGL